jgi:hypothetical protein
MNDEKQQLLFSSTIPSHHHPDADESVAIMDEEASVLFASVEVKKDNDVDDEATSTSTSSTQYCPLFMTGLPRDFSTNPQLAALASLLEEDDDDENDDGDAETAAVDDDDDKMSSGDKDSGAVAVVVVGRSKKPVTMPSKGGGKVRVEKSRAGRRSQEAPYSSNKPAPSSGDEANQKEKQQMTCAASLGEAQLFLNMWKL